MGQNLPMPKFLLGKALYLCYNSNEVFIMQNLFKTHVELEKLALIDLTGKNLDEEYQKNFKKYIKTFIEQLSTEEETRNNLVTFEVECLEHLLQICKGTAIYEHFTSDDIPIDKIFEPTNKYKLSIIIIEIKANKFPDLHNVIMKFDTSGPVTFYFGIRQNNELKADFEVHIIGAKNGKRK